MRSLEWAWFNWIDGFIRRGNLDTKTNMRRGMMEENVRIFGRR